MVFARVKERWLSMGTEPDDGELFLLGAKISSLQKPM
jgi:hypothetical protein